MRTRLAKLFGWRARGHFFPGHCLLYIEAAYLLVMEEHFQYDVASLPAQLWRASAGASVHLQSETSELTPDMVPLAARAGGAV